MNTEIAITDALDRLERKLEGVEKHSRDKYVRISKEVVGGSKVGLVRIKRTPFGAMIDSVSDSFCNMVGISRETMEGKYLHHITGGSQKLDLKLCDQIDRDGGAVKMHWFMGKQLRGTIIKEKDGLYTEFVTIVG